MLLGIFRKKLRQKGEIMKSEVVHLYQIMTHSVVIKLEHQELVISNNVYSHTPLFQSNMAHQKK